MADKTLVCRCEDVTLDDVKHAIELGYKDIEEVKRYTGFGTGPCQGKECQAVIAIFLASEAEALSAVSPFTARSPLEPAPLKLFCPKRER